MNELISVILPVYNGSKYLSESIESIMNQTYKNIEIIIINDGSKDNSLDIINEYSDKDDRIKVISRENKGLITSLNEAIDNSNGKYIARMDQDDICLLNRLEIQYEYMIENNLDICGGNYIEIDEKGEKLSQRKVLQKNYMILLVLASNVPFAHPSVMIKKDFLEKNNLKYGLNGKKEAEDLDLWMNMYNSGAKLGNVNLDILKYRILATSMSRVNHKKIMKEVNNQFNLFVQKNLDEFYKAFHSINKSDLSNDNFDLIYVRALLRFSIFRFDLSLWFVCIKKLGILGIFKGLLSFIKLKYLY